MSDHNLQVSILLCLDTSVRLWVSRSTGTVYFPLLQFLVYVFAVLTDWVEGLEQHAFTTYLWGCGCCRRLRQINWEVWNNQWATNIIRMKLRWLETTVLSVLKVCSRRRLFQILLLWPTVHNHALSGLLWMLLALMHLTFCVIEAIQLGSVFTLDALRTN